MLSQLVIEYIIVACIAMDRCGAISSDCTKFECDSMLSRIPMINTMVITASSIIVAPSTTKMTTVQAQPQVSLKVTACALCSRLNVDMTCDEALIQIICVGA